jgi:hypothetical protein
MNQDDTGVAPATGVTEPATGGAPEPTPRGGVAEAIFAEVEQMTAGGAMSKSDAFEDISRRTGRRAGTVAANYYRIARKRGVALQPRGRRGTARAQATSGTGTVADALAAAERAVADLAAAVRAQQDELTRLREQAEQFAKLREIIARNA